MEQVLQEEGISVQKGLQDLIQNLEKEKSYANQEETYKLQRLIDTAEKLLKDSTQQEDEISERSAMDALYSNAVSAAVVYFNSQGYYLSAELLLHAEDNKELNSTYVPYFTDPIEKHPLWRKLLRASAGQSGSGEFEQKYGDVYFAIHKFDWSKKNGRITLSDRYDFAPERYAGIQQIAINILVSAQNDGYITPYYVKYSERCE